jgi:hypothetical protein
MSMPFPATRPAWLRPDPRYHACNPRQQHGIGQNIQVEICQTVQQNRRQRARAKYRSRGSSDPTALHTAILTTENAGAAPTTSPQAQRREVFALVSWQHAAALECGVIGKSGQSHQREDTTRFPAFFDDHCLRRLHRPMIDAVVREGRHHRGIELTLMLGTTGYLEIALVVVAHVHVVRDEPLGKRFPQFLDAIT